MTIAVVIGCFTGTFSSERVNFHNVWQWQKKNRLEGLFRSPFTELSPSFPFNSIKNLFKVQWMDFHIFFAFELYYSLFRILMIKSSYRVDRAFFNFLFNSFEILLLVIICFGHKDMK